MMKVQSVQGLCARIRTVLRKHGYEVASSKDVNLRSKIVVSGQSARYAYSGNVFINQMDNKARCVKDIKREILTVLHEFDPEVKAMTYGINEGRTYIVVPYELL
ncbi:hypothetical protein [Bacillus phage Anath]|uniref:Uncharacterized protein n=1 Tax=Bacillus phage Anath TaxID=2108114 RepID=A0A2P1JUP7_9CAUD|nr:hypothetical protein [Bacillus phage Anath]